MTSYNNLYGYIDYNILTQSVSKWINYGHSISGTSLIRGTIYNNILLYTCSKSVLA